MTRARLVLLAGALVVAGAVVLVASQSDRRLLGSNRVPLVIYIVRLGVARAACQPAALPAHTGTLRVPVFTHHRPRPALTVTAGRDRLGGVPAGPPTATFVDIPIRPQDHETVLDELCVRAAAGAPVDLGGARVERRYAARNPGGRRLGGLARFEYETAGPQTWWSALGGIAQRFADGKAGWVGPWTLVLVALLGVGAAAAAGWAVGGGRGGLVVGCAVAALLNLVAWSVLTPPFHVPDETAHFAYAQTLAESGRPPAPRARTAYSPEEAIALKWLFFGAVIGQPRNLPPSLPTEERRLRAVLARSHGRLGNGGASVATSQPPLFYALADVPYAAAGGGSILTRLSLMRLVACLFGVATVLCSLGFLREALPGAPWAWAAGALAVAFQPTFAFVSSGLNPDAMLFAGAAGLFWALAAAFRRGLSPARGAAIGVALLTGMLAKLTFLGLLPGVAVALAYLLWRDRRRHAAARGALIAVALLALPLAAYVLLNVEAWNRPALGLGGLASLARPDVGAGGGGQTLGGLLSYTWQLYLPRLPIMYDWLPGLPIRDLWLHGLVGRFGWLDYGFPGWVYDVALAVVVALVALAAVGLARVRAALPRRLPELAVYAVMTAGLLFAIARAGFDAVTSGQPPFEQARYLLPLLALYAAWVTLAARAGGRRWGPALAALLVVVAIGHDVFAGLITLARYYG